MNNKILIVDDEVAICDLLKLDLEMEGFTCYVANDGNEAIDMYSAYQPEVIILDVMLPGMSGFDVCREIKKTGDASIIMLTAKTDIVDKVLGLELGADDYLTKPFDFRELLARIKVLLRRNAPAHAPKKMAYGEIVLLPESQSAKVCGKPIQLTPKEYDILLLFIQNPGIVFTREKLLKEIWSTDYHADTRTVDMHIQRLRKKLGALSEEKYIETIFKVGYKLRGLDED